VRQRLRPQWSAARRGRAVTGKIPLARLRLEGAIAIVRLRKISSPAASERLRRSIDLLTLIVVCSFLFLAGIQSIGLLGPDEPRYAQVAREMLARHDWVTPTLFGKPWLEKPPLYYWLTAISYQAAGGVHDWAARMPSVVLTSLLVFFIYFWTRRFYRGMQLDAAMITAGAAGVIVFSRAASMDMPLTAAFTAAMLCWFAWHTQKSRLWLLAFYFLLALGTLAKGPVATFLAVAIIIAFIALRRSWKLLPQMLWPAGILLFLVVALPWYIAVQRANPEFFRVFILEHNLARYTSDLYRHKQPFWYYIPVAVLGLLPWTVFAIAALVDAVRDWRYSTEQPAGEEDFRTFLAIWFVFPILFFSLSQSKLPGYILPAIPAGAILLADFIRRRELDGDKPAWWLVVLHAVVSAALLIGAFVVPFKLLALPLPATVLIVATLLAVCALAFFTATLLGRGYKTLRFTTYVPIVIAFALVLRGTAPIVDALQSARTVQASLQTTALGQLPDIAVYDVPRGIEYGLGFYRNHLVGNYGRNEIPDGTHIVVAAAGAKTELEYRLPNRKVTRFGGWAPQHLDFYLVAPKPADSE
jgi:4-amino-4-deoxy-L-arabinose transferase-like glycosyltransferase